MFRLLREQKGAAVAVIAISMTAMIGFAALVIDGGNLYLNKTRLVNLADAAALAGAQDLPGDPQSAIASAYSYAAQNGMSNDTIDVTISNDNTIVTVNASRTVPFFFAQIFHMNSSNVSARAAAAIKPITGVGNIVPFGIVKQPFKYNQTYTLKAGGGSGYNGNYAALALGGTGSTIYEGNITNGYKGQLLIDKLVTTETGVMSGATSKGVKARMEQDKYATFETMEKNSPRILTVPIIESLEVNGRGEVLVVGFAAFFLEDIGGNGHENYVTGKFIQTVVLGDTGTGTANYGLYGSSLIE